METTKKRPDAGVLADAASKSRRGVIHEIRRGKDGKLYCTCEGWRFTKHCRHVKQFVLEHASWQDQPVVRPLEKKEGKSMGPAWMRTKHGYESFVMISALQKCIRRGLEREAYAYAKELADTGKTQFSMLMNRLICITHEDVGIGDIGAGMYVMQSLHWLERQYDKKKDWDLILANVILALCRARKKSHEAIYLSGLHNDEMEFGRKKLPKVPDCSYDIHTQKGRSMGRDWKHFVTEAFILDRPTVTPLQAQWEMMAYCQNKMCERAVYEKEYPPQPVEEPTSAPRAATPEDLKAEADSESEPE